MSVRIMSSRKTCRINFPAGPQLEVEEKKWTKAYGMISQDAWKELSETQRNAHFNYPLSFHPLSHLLFVFCSIPNTISVPKNKGANNTAGPGVIYKLSKKRKMEAQMRKTEAGQTLGLLWSPLLCSRGHPSSAGIFKRPGWKRDKWGLVR